MTTGERIRAVRKKAGLTQKELSTRCGFSEVAIRKWEAGKREPKIATFRKLAEALGILLKTIISDNNEETEETT